MPDTNPLGQQIRFPDAPTPWLVIIGVVGEPEAHRTMRWVESPISYRPLAQNPRQVFRVAIRTAATQGSIGREVQNQLAAFDPTIPASELQPVTAELSRLLAYPRFRSFVFSFFAAISHWSFLPSGCMACCHRQLSNACPNSGSAPLSGLTGATWFFLVARQGAAPVLAGLALGRASTLGAACVLAHLLYGVEPADPSALIIASVALVAVTAVAIVVAAARAARVDPVIALRDL